MKGRLRQSWEDDVAWAAAQVIEQPQDPQVCCAPKPATSYVAYVERWARAFFETDPDVLAFVAMVAADRFDRARVMGIAWDRDESGKRTFWMQRAAEAVRTFIEISKR